MNRIISVPILDESEKLAPAAIKVTYKKEIKEIVRAHEAGETSLWALPKGAYCCGNVQVKHGLNFILCFVYLYSFMVLTFIMMTPKLLFVISAGVPIFVNLIALGMLIIYQFFSEKDYQKTELEQKLLRWSMNLIMCSAFLINAAPTIFMKTKCMDEEPRGCDDYDWLFET